MTVESERPTFRGVLCLHCQEPIPVPAIVRKLQADTEQSEVGRAKSQVFNLRCPSCHKEKPYRLSEIMEFEGSVEPGVVPGRSTPLRWAPQQNLVRAAKV
jgi:hypothetical protein